MSNDGIDPYSSNPMRKTSGKNFQSKQIFLGIDKINEEEGEDD